MTEIPPLNIFIPDVTGREYPKKTFTSSLSPGAVVEALVTREAGEGGYYLKVKGQEFLVKTSLPLDVGITLKVKVEALSPVVVFHLLGESKRTSIPFPNLSYRLSELFLRGREILFPFLASGKPGEGIIKKIVTLLEELTFGPESRKNPFFLKEFLSKLGVFLENELARYGGKELIAERDSLKGLLLQLAVSAQEDKVLATFIRESLEIIENIQLLNLFAAERGYLIIPLPLFLGPAIKEGEVFVKKGEKGLFHVVLFLPMDALGGVTVDVTLKGERISCHFYLEREDAATLIGTYLDGLKEAISRCGYKWDRLSLSVTPKMVYRQLWQTESMVNVLV